MENFYLIGIVTSCDPSFHYAPLPLVVPQHFFPRHIYGELWIAFVVEKKSVRTPRPLNNYSVSLDFEVILVFLYTQFIS